MTMEKKRYYVTVGSGEILPDKTLSEWEFEIDATPEEARQLEEIFENADDASMYNFWKAHVPFQEETEDDTETYNSSLKHIYEKIYELGTKTTKEHIRSMRILN
jgi:hypothetical protein